MEGPRRAEPRASRAVEIAAGLSADRLRVDESEAKVRQGFARSLRRGLPPSGARRGVTYRDVTVGIRIEGEARIDEGAD
ncbi:MAG: hypothetical protein DIU72_010810 [Pseudomonadota bacterium]|nr:MAG: hypothetical protein DIU72_10725 [Pseudomonadota bacterium]